MHEAYPSKMTSFVIQDKQCPKFSGLLIYFNTLSIVVEGEDDQIIFRIGLGSVAAQAQFLPLGMGTNAPKNPKLILILEATMTLGDIPTWFFTIILEKIYHSRYLLLVYKIFKFWYGILTGTTEILRSCRLTSTFPPNNEFDTDEKATPSELTTSSFWDMDKDLSPNINHVGLWDFKALKKNMLRIHPEIIYRIGTARHIGNVVVSSLLMDYTIIKLWVDCQDRSILFSSKLEHERRELEMPDGSVNEVFHRILQKKRFPQYGNPNSPEAYVLRDCLEVIQASYKLVSELNQRAQTKYDSTNQQHERKLLELWDALMPHQKLEDRYTEKWNQIGFQGRDPATDFRGMGMLGLDDLLYFAKIHPEKAQFALECSHHPTSWYSFAIVGINITSLALNILRTRRLQYFLFRYGTCKETYHEFFGYLFTSFNDFWVSYETPITVMDFSRVLEEFKKKIDKELLEHPRLLQCCSPQKMEGEREKVE